MNHKAVSYFLGIGWFAAWLAIGMTLLENVFNRFPEKTALLVPFYIAAWVVSLYLGRAILANLANRFIQKETHENTTADFHKKYATKTTENINNTPWPAIAAITFVVATTAAPHANEISEGRARVKNNMELVSLGSEEGQDRIKDGTVGTLYLESA